MLVLIRICFGTRTNLTLHRLRLTAFARKTMAATSNGSNLPYIHMSRFAPTSLAHVLRARARHVLRARF